MYAYSLTNTNQCQGGGRIIMQNTKSLFMAPSSSYMSEDLLFFDTFSHSNSDKDNFDLVQFPSPVIVDLIKIVPLGQPVEANIPGNVRLGATNPSKCEMEFFINDLTKQDAHTMTDLGKFYCSEKDTDFIPPIQIQTDGLLLRGSYRTLTLAIFGQIVAFDEKPESEQAIISAASPPAQTPASPVASDHEVPYIVRSIDQESLKRSREEDDSIEEPIIKADSFAQEDSSNLENLDDVIAEQADAVQEVESAKEDMNLEETSISIDVSTPISPNNRDRKREEIDYSNNSDVDNISKRTNKHDTGDRHRRNKSRVSDRHQKQHQDHRQQAQQQSISEDCFADYDVQEWFFNIETYSPKPLTYFPDPSLTLQERTLLAHKSIIDTQKLDETEDKEVDKVKEMFEVMGCSGTNKTEDWVTLVEDLTNDITNMSLSQTVSDEDMLEYLVKQVLCGLDLTSALGQKQTGFKVRHLKAGLKLATILFHCGRPAVEALLKADVLSKVLQLYNQDQMTLPLRLHIFKCLNAACDIIEGVEYVIRKDYQWTDASIIMRQIEDKLRNVHEDHKSDIDPKAFKGSHDSLTCYQYMLLLLLNQPATRITIAIGNLMKKIRLYQDLSDLNALTRSKDILTDIDDSVFKTKSDNLEEKILLEKGSKIVQDVILLTKDGCLQIAQPVRYLPAKAQFHIKPSPSDSYLAFYKWIKHFRIIECLDFLLVSTRTNVLDIEHSIKLRGLCLALIQQILDLPRGTQLLLSSDCYEQTTKLIRNLAQKIDPFRRKSHPGIENLVANSLCREESLSAATCRDMSLKLAYSFKVLSCIDKLFFFHRELISKKRSSESTQICEPEKVLHQLFIISDHPYGLTAIMKHFSCIGNLDCILRFLDMPEYQKHLEFVRETSIDYVLELVGTFFRLNNNVLEIAEEYLETLVDLCKIKDKTLSTRIKSLLPWLTPFESDQPFPLITYSEETFRQLARVIRKSIPDCSIPFAQGLNYEIPPQLITAVRILRQLCISPQVESFIETNFDIFSTQRLLLANEAKSSTSLPFVDSLPRQQNPNQSWNLNLQVSQNISVVSTHSSEDSLMDHLGQLNNLSKLYMPYDESICGDLKYHYGIMQIFEQEGLKRLLNTLRELTGNYPRPIYQSAALCGLRGRIVISYIHSVIMLLHSMTCHLIDARGKEFQDTSIIGVVLETYSLLCFVPKPEYDKLNELSKIDELSALQKSITLKYDNYQLAQQAKKLILSILMSYTQICLSVSESEENVISKSMWTRMLKEVIDFTLSAPVFFDHGLDILTRILPSPMPSPNLLDTVDQEQLFNSINHRKLWSAHLHPLHNRIELMISNLSLCSQSSIRTLMCYLCYQLCDLSSNAACMVAKTITDTLITCAARLSVDSASCNETTTGEQVSRQSEERTTGPCPHIIINGTKESRFAVRMVLNVLTNLITNRAFENAITNHLQIISKKDEKLLLNLHTIIKSQGELKQADHVNIEGSNENTNKVSTTVAALIESIRFLAESISLKENSHASIAPPDELTKINLIEMARKTSDRFSITTGITKTYRLKVLMDINSRAQGSNELSSNTKRFERAPASNHQEFLVQPSHKPFVASIRGRGSRSSTRPDSFRSRPQNTSRPPSIHVDEFNDLFGEASANNTGLPTGASRYGGPSALSRGDKAEYRMSPASGRYHELSHCGRVTNSPMSGSSHGRQVYYNPGPPPPGSSGLNYSPHHHHHHQQQQQQQQQPPQQQPLNESGCPGGVERGSSLSGGGSGGRRSKYMKTK